MQIIKYTLIIYWLISLLDAQIVFNENILDDNVGGNGSIYGIDIDNDGDIDMLVAGIEDNSIILYQNDGGKPVEWTKLIVDSNVSGARSVHANDFDNDGDLDVVGSSYTGMPSVLWWRNDGGIPIIWTRQSVSLVFRNSHEVYSIDIDNDDNIDILSASSDLNTVAIWYNKGGNPIVWDRQTLGASETLAKSVHAGDIDGDGDIDVVSAAIISNDIVWWENTGGNPIIWNRNVVDYNFVGAHRVEIVDIDGDGSKDILGAGYLGDEVAWWKNSGGAPITWEKQSIGLQFKKACIATANDIDGDGDNDVIATGQESNEVSWWENDGSSPINWTKHIITSSFLRPWPLFVEDIDSDGDKDVFVSSSHNGNRKIYWWENTLALNVKDENNSNDFILLQNFPNPFNPNTTIKYELSTPSHINLSIFDIEGKYIETLVDQFQEEGNHSFEWNGKDYTGRLVSNGTYLCKINSELYNKTIKITFLK